MKYVIGDIHGYLDRMFDVLHKANFDWDNDELYVIGDVIDRGPQSAKALHWAVEEAPSNVYFLLGNHEDMAYKGLSSVLDILGIESFLYDDPWSWNGGYQTLYECRERYGSDWCHKAARWINKLPMYYIVDDKLLVHAGLCSGGRRLSDDFILNGRNEDVYIPGIKEPQWTQHLLWARERWFYDYNDYPYDIIFGHTPTTLDWMSKVKENQWVFQEKDLKPISIQGGPGYIVRESGFSNYKVRYCIDTGRERMGLLRLDDYAEFYSEVSCG